MLNSFEIITSSIRKLGDPKIILNRLRNLFHEPQDKQLIDNLLKFRVDIFHNFKSGVGLELIKFLGENINTIETSIKNLSIEDFQQVQTVIQDMQQLSLEGVPEAIYSQPQGLPVVNMQYQQYLLQQEQLYYQQQFYYQQQYQQQSLQPWGYLSHLPNYYSQTLYQPLLANQAQLNMQQQGNPQQSPVHHVAYNPNTFFHHTLVSINPNPTQALDEEKKAEKNENTPNK